MKHILSLLLLTSVLLTNAQQKPDVADYIQKYKQVALEEMVRCHIPASITLAQGIHESSCGKSPLSREANNHFGIKCKEEWDGKKYYQNDDAPNECFRVYDHAQASYADHSDFLVTRPRYANLFDLPITDYKSWALGLKADGYATNPKYAQILINTILENNLDQYDQLGLAMIEERNKLVGAPVDEQASLNKGKTKAEKKERESVVVASVKPERKKASEAAPVTETVVVVGNATNSRKEYVVNGMRALKAQGPEDPLKIAFDYNLDYTTVLSFNDLGNGEHFKDGEYIYLQAKRNKASELNYTVQQGENMRDIAQRFGIKVKELYSKNQMKPNDQPVAGELVALQEKRSEAPRTMTYEAFLKTVAELNPKPQKDKPDSATRVPNHPTTASTQQHITQKSAYQVQQTDTIYSIARKFNISVDELRAINNLNGSDIKIGQVLVVNP